MNGKLHVEKVLGKLLVPFARKIREAHGKEGAKVMYLEDCAPCHTGDSCPKSKILSGLKAKRRRIFEEEGIIRHLYSKNGTPKECWNDQMHKLLFS